MKNMNNNKGSVLIAALLTGAIFASVVGIGVSFYKDKKQEAEYLKLVQQIEKARRELQITPEKLGAFRPSNYVGKLTTRLIEGGSESTFNTNPGEAADGTTLTTAKLGDFIVLTINPGAANEEKISVSAVSTTGSTTATWTIINRGLSFTENVAVSGNKKQHAIGETVIISNDDHYLNQQFLDIDSSQNIIGLKTFNTILPTSSLTATTSLQFVNKSLLDATINQGAATSTETNGGIIELGTLSEQETSFDGGIDKPTVLQTKNSTSSCQVVGAYNLVASSTTGKLDSNCLDQALDYTWTGNTSISNPLTLNGVSYNFPSSDGASSTALMTDGSGGLTWNSSVSVASSTVITATTIWSVPTGVTSVKATLVGGGGGSGDIGGSGDSATKTGGGGGGAYCEGEVDVTSGGTLQVNIGSGGIGGTTGQNGTAGSDTSVVGDNKTITAGGGSGSDFKNSAGQNGAGASGGSCTNSKLSITGQTGRNSSNEIGGGSGGSTPLGFGGYGAEVTGSGSVGAGYGAGGGGAWSTNNDGANGTQGVVILEFLIAQ